MPRVKEAGARVGARCKILAQRMVPATHEDLASVAELEGQAGVGDQVGQAVGTAQQTSLGVVAEAGLGALDGGLQGQGGRGLSVVLRAGREGSGVGISSLLSQQLAIHACPAATADMGRTHLVHAWLLTAACWRQTEAYRLRGTAIAPSCRCLATLWMQADPGPARAAIYC